MESAEITEWIEQLKQGDAVAAERLWATYFDRLVRLARTKLEGGAHRGADEEDIALSAFKSFCLGAREGKFGKLTDRGNLWPLLVAITANKTIDQKRRDNRIRRGGSGTSSANDEQEGPLPRQTVSLNDVVVLSEEPSPEFAASLAEEFERLMARLDATGDTALKSVAILRMDGLTTGEVAEKLGCARRTIERKLVIIERMLRQPDDARE